MNEPTLVQLIEAFEAAESTAECKHARMAIILEMLAIDEYAMRHNGKVYDLTWGNRGWRLEIRFYAEPPLAADLDARRSQPQA